MTESSSTTTDQHLPLLRDRELVQPVQILSPVTPPLTTTAPLSATSSFQLNEEALRTVLADPRVADRKVVVISVAGAFRKGKSFLLNFFLEYLYSLKNSQEQDYEFDWLAEDKQLQGFHWSAGAKRDTSGIWMWGEAIMVMNSDQEKVAVVLVDTQGTFDNSSTYRQCTTIFALSTMISSMQIYNMQDTIQEDSLQNLSLFVEYGRLAIKEGAGGRSRESNSESAEVGDKPFQTLVFLVRDFKSPDEYPYGKEGGRALLDDVLKVNREQPEELQNVREQINACFDSICCYLLPHPGFKVSERVSFRGHVRDIRPAFKEEMRKMVTDLLHPSALQIKRIGGRPITCRQLLDCFREYATTFDGDKLPEPRSILNANATLMCMEAVVDARRAYIRGMDRACRGRRMLPDKRLNDAHIKYGIQALNIYDKCPKIGTGDVRQKHLSRLQGEINAEFDRYKRQNLDKRVTGLASALTACGDSVFFGVGLGAATSASIAAAALTIEMGIVSAGIVAIPVSLTSLMVAWIFVYIRPKLDEWLEERGIE